MTIDGSGKMDETGDMMTASSTASSEDSGFDNDYLSDSSLPGTIKCGQHVCVFCDYSNSKDNHINKCALNKYSLSGFSIKTISPRTFQYFANCIRELDLSNNEIQSLPIEIGQLKNLEELNLSRNSLFDVPESAKELCKLKVLNLSSNFLCKTPKCLEFGMDRLTQIDLSFNYLNKFENSPMCLPLLQNLNLSHNNFGTLPLWLFSDQCRSLLELDVSHNFCFDDTSMNSKLPVLKHHRTSVLKTLLKINVSNTGTKLGMISSLSDFESLQCFHMGNVGGPESSYNCFWEIPVDFFFNPLCVIELHLKKVGLAGLPENFSEFKNLKVLDVSENPVDWLPECFGQLKCLEELIVTSCNVSYLPDNFNQLCRLKKLLLDHNKLYDVNGKLTGLQSLEWLDLYNNCLEELPFSLTILRSLKKLDLAANHVDLEVALDYKLDGEHMLDIYIEKQTALRSTNLKYASRRDGNKVPTNITSWDSYASLYKDSRSSDCDSRPTYSEIDNQEVPDLDTPPDDEEEENWDEDSSCCSHTDFDPNVVYRLMLVAGTQKFGWTPPIRQRECVVPWQQRLRGHVFVPADSLPKGRKRRVNRRLLPTVEDQFKDHPVDVKADLQKLRSILDSLKRTHWFVRNPKGPGKFVSCYDCATWEHDYCYHRGIWKPLSSMSSSLHF